MSEFLGSWRLLSVDNFDGYLKELGINVVLRKLAALTVPTVIFSRDDQDYWTMRTETMVRSMNAHFRLGEQFKETTIDERKVDSIFILENVGDNGGQELIQWQTDKMGRKSRLGRTVRKDRDGNTFMDVSMNCNDVVSTAVFKKVEQ